MRIKPLDVPGGATVRVVMRTGAGHERTPLEVIAAALDVAPDELELENDVRGKPVIRRPPTELRFSIAHTAGLTLTAFAIGVDVGVDVENLNRDVTRWTLWEQTLTSDEVSRLPPDRATRNAFLLQHWVRRESLLKAAGVGLAVEPRTIELTADGAIAVLPHELGVPSAWSLDDIVIPGYAAAIACRPGVAAVEVEVESDSSIALPAAGTVGTSGLRDRPGPGSM